jgi:hypothetical protein
VDESGTVDNCGYRHRDDVAATADTRYDAADDYSYLPIIGTCLRSRLPYNEIRTGRPPKHLFRIDYRPDAFTVSIGSSC